LRYSPQLQESESKMDLFLGTIESVHFDTDMSRFVDAQKAGLPHPPPQKEYDHPEPGYPHEVSNQL